LSKYSGENCVEIFDAEKARPLDRDVPLCLPLRSSTVQVVLHTGLQALATSQRLGLRRHASRHLWPRAWELRTNLSAYYALYVALAEQLGATLLTADARAARAPRLHCPVEVMAP
jgi:predicted nucleic acid-binding protein